MREGKGASAFRVKRRKCRWTPEEEEALIAAYSGPDKVHVIAAKMGRSVEAVETRAMTLRAAGRIVNRNPRVADDVRAVAVELCAAGKTMLEAAERTGVSHQAIANWRRRAGAPARKWTRIDAAAEKKIRAMRMVRRSTIEIAAEVGAHPATIGRAIAKMGLSGRLRSQPKARL